MIRSHAHWVSVGERVRKERDDKEHLCLQQDGDANEGGITSLLAHELKREMESGRLRCEQIVTAFCRRSHAVGRGVLNCVTEEVYDEAIEAARELDLRRANGSLTTADLAKPLLGVPVSIKDSFHQRGTRATCGVACKAEDVAEEDGLVVKLLREAGAIPFVKSNTPQLLMTIESTNRVWGQSDNPWKADRGTGGSSGGEGGLVSARASPLGLGSDIGGSIRIPAAFCGTCGFKPTTNRFTFKGSAVPRLNARSGQIAIPPVAGPLANCVEDCSLLMQALSTPTAWRDDPYAAPVPWDAAEATTGISDSSSSSSRSSSSSSSSSSEANSPEPTASEEPPLQLLPTTESMGALGGGRKLRSANTNSKRKVPQSGTQGGAPKRKLRVGVFSTDEWFEPCSAVKRGVSEASAALSAAGHDVRPFALPVSGWKIAILYYSLLGAEGNMIGFRLALQGEQLLPLYKQLLFYSNIPNFLRPLLCTILSLMGEKRKSALLGSQRSGGLSVRQYWELCADLRQLKTDYVAAMKQQEFDVLLFPGMPLPALQHGGATSLTPACSYTFLANLLQWPAGTVPVTRVGDVPSSSPSSPSSSLLDDGGEETYSLASLPVDQRDSVAGAAAKVMQASKGLPLAVQVMGLPFQDEVVVYAMREVERVVAFRQGPNL